MLEWNVMAQTITAKTPDAKYAATDQEMYKAEQTYTAFENELLDRVANIENSYPGFHDYLKNIDQIGHDPYVLISILSAVKQDFKTTDPEIINLFETMKKPRRQYTLTITKHLAEEFKDQFSITSPSFDLDNIDNQYLDLHIKLTNYDLGCTVDSLLSHDQLKTYAGFLRSHGCRPDLFPKSKYPHATELNPPFNYVVPVETRGKYPMLDQELAIGEKVIGYPYVWGGGDIETSFDCSGFVSYVLDNLGYKFRNVVRGKTARLPVAGSTIHGIFYDGLYEKCQYIEPNNRQPGDLIFFTGSFDASYRKNNLTHVGFYVGNEIFLACGSPNGVGYQSLDSTCPGKKHTWRDSLVCYGRINPELKTTYEHISK